MRLLDQEDRPADCSSAETARTEICAKGLCDVTDSALWLVALVWKSLTFCKSCTLFRSDQRGEGNDTVCPTGEGTCSLYTCTPVAGNAR